MFLDYLASLPVYNKLTDRPFKEEMLSQVKMLVSFC